MAALAPQDYSHALQQLMQRAGISSFKALSRAADVSERQIRNLRQGKVAQTRLEIFEKLAQALQIPVSELLATFAGIGESSAELRQEYQRLQAQLQQQRQELIQEFQQSSLDVLETWLKQWPLAVSKVKENAPIEPMTLVRLVQPVEKLIQHWGLEPLAAIGEEISYDPQWQVLTKGTAQPGDPVKVIRTGYRQGEKLLYRAEVAPV